MLLRIISFIMPFVMLFVGLGIGVLEEDNIFFGVKFPKLDEIQDIFKKYKRLFIIYFIVSWVIVNGIIISIDVFTRQPYALLMIILTVIINALIIITIHGGINSRLKVLKRREVWGNLIYNNKMFVDKKSGRELTIEDNDYLFGMLYCNPKDSSLFVEKRSGKGIAINFGNIIGKSIGIIVILAIIIGVSVTTYRSVSIANATSLNVVVEENEIVISGTFGEILPYKEMSSIKYLNNIPTVQMKLDGVESGNRYFGLYDIAGVGGAKLYIENINDPVIEIKANGYLPVYINYNKLSSTQWLYKSITK